MGSGIPSIPGFGGMRFTRNRANAPTYETVFAEWWKCTPNRDADTYSASNVLRLAPAASYGQYCELAHADTTDVDTSSDFSAEVAVMIEPFRGGGRWPFLFGKGSLSYLTNAGWGFDLNNGQYEAYSHTVVARVADGTTQASVTHVGIIGPCHLLMTWTAATKTLCLYVNGVLKDTDTKAGIVLANISSTASLKIGKYSGGSGSLSLERDILLARMWNRALSQDDATSLGTAFVAGKNVTPADVSRTGLVSEWLMDELSNAAGESGTTHVKDAVGSNHLELKGGATLSTASGALALAYPENEATGISPSVMLIATGGASTLSDATGPLSYYFQVDRVNTFDSANLQESEWVPRYGAWVPILEPEVKHYARVRCRNANATETSDYTAASEFTVRAAATWYVRPLVSDGTLDGYLNYVPTASTYGDQDGTSYANAWNGLKDIVWGQSGVSAGDTLYICGEHTVTRHGSGGTSHTFQFVECIGVSGYSATHPLTIRMDYESDAGVLVDGQFLGDSTLASAWTGPDENGVYYTDRTSLLPIERVSARSYLWLTELPEELQDTTWTDYTGYYWLDTSINRLYVKLQGEGEPATSLLYCGTTHTSPTGAGLIDGRQPYVTFEGCTWFHGTSWRSGSQADGSPSYIYRASPTHRTYHNCKIQYSQQKLFLLDDGCDDWTFDNCELSHGGDGIYVTGTWRTTVKHCYIHDIGEGIWNIDNDSHAIGTQGFGGHLYEYNETYNTGGAMEFWSDGSFDTVNCTVRYNYLHHVRGLKSSLGSGVTFSGGDNSGSWDGFRCYGNIIANIGDEDTEGWQGFGINIETRAGDSIEVFNNLVYRATTVSINDQQSDACTTQIYNNIAIDQIGTAFAYFNIAASSFAGGMLQDNIVYGSAGTPAKTFVVSPTGQGTVSGNVVADPVLTTFPPTELAHFALDVSSPAWALGWQEIPISDIGIVES